MNVHQLEYQDQPFEVSLETHTVCNATCKFCPYPEIERKGNKMPDELIYRLIDEMGTFEKPFYFSPFKLSDPLLDKRLHIILQRVNEKAPLARIRIFTNGSALTWDNAEKLHDIDNLELYISLNEYRPDEYKELMGLDFKKTTRNIDELHKSDFRHPVTILKVGVDRAFKEYCQRRWPDFITILVKKDGWLGFTEPDDGYHYDPEFCSRWYELSIMSTGEVALCCMDSEGKYSVGNVSDKSLLSVYNSNEYRRYRESKRDLTPCKDCTY